MILLGVGQFHITDGAGRLAKLAGDSFAALAADSEGPRNAVAFPYLGLPFRADCGQIGGESIRGSAALGAMDDDDGLRGELHARVVFDEQGVMPGFHVAEKDSGEGFRGKLEWLRDLGQIVGDADGARSLRDLNDGRHAGQLVVSEGRVGGSEVHGAGLYLLYSSARADGLVIDLDAGVGLGEILDPAGHN